MKKNWKRKLFIIHNNLQCIVNCKKTLSIIVNNLQWFTSHAI